MPRQKQADRSTVAEKNVTFRASPRTRALLDALVARASQQAAGVGGSASIGSYLKALIEREAEAAGIQVEGEGAEAPPSKAAPRSKTTSKAPASKASPKSAGRGRGAK